jgi:hypothetical protein
VSDQASGNIDPIEIPANATREIIRAESKRRLNLYYGACPRAFAAAYAQCALSMCDTQTLHEIADAVMQVETARATNDAESHSAGLAAIFHLLMVADVPLPEINADNPPCFVAAANMPTITNFPRVEVAP